MKKKRLTVFIGFAMAMLAALFLFPRRLDTFYENSFNNYFEVLSWDFGYNSEENSYWDYYLIEEEESVDYIESLLKKCYVHLSVPFPGSSPSGAVTIGYKSGDRIVWIQENGDIRIEKGGKISVPYHCYAKEPVRQLIQYYNEIDAQVIHDKRYMEH